MPSTMNWLRESIAKLLNLHPATEWGTSRSWINYGHQDARIDLSKGDRVQLQKMSRYFAAGDGLYNRMLDLFEQYVGVELFPATSSPEYNVRAAARWSDWKRYADIASRDGWDVDQGRVVRSFGENGECFIVLVMEVRYPRIQMIEAHRCCSPDNAPDNIVDGVEMDPNGRPIAYWFKTDEKTIRRYDAAYVIHVFEPERIGQVRGIPLISCVLNELRDLHDLRSNEVRASKVASLIGIVRKNKAGELSSSDRLRSKFSVTNTSPTGATTEQNRSSYYESALGKDVVVMQTDDEMSQFLNNRPTDSVRALWRDLKETICVGFGWPYVIVCSDGMQGTVYRGAVAAAAAFSRARCVALRPHIQRVYEWVIGNDPALISGRPQDWQKTIARFPRSPSVDIGYDTNAAISSLAAGLTNWQELYAERGDNWMEQLEQKARESAFIAELAAKYNLTVQQIAAASLPQPAQNQPQPQLESV